MRINLVLDENLTKEALEEIFNQTTYIKNDVGTETFKKYETVYISELIQGLLLNLNDKNTKFNIHLCHTYIGDFIADIDEWIIDLPYTYEDINNKENFEWAFTSRMLKTPTPCISFEYLDEKYKITLKGENIDLTWQEEIISIELLKKEIEFVRKTYYDYINKNLGNVLPDYLKVLDLSFDD